MRDASIAVLREIGIEPGGSNVQFAVNPADGRLVIIEMNPRVSRSSALASKATGFPIAKVAAKLAVGYTLDEIANDITGGATPAGLLKCAQAMRAGIGDDLIHASSKIDPWFLAQIRGIVDTETEVKAKGLPKTPGALRRLKSMGFSDVRLAKLTGLSTDEVSKRRRALGVRPVFKRIDTCAAEFASPTAYMYSTYEPPFDGKATGEAAP